VWVVLVVLYGKFVLLFEMYGGFVLLFGIILCVGSAGGTVWGVCVVVWDNTVCG